jgi:hypothetical protein
MRRYAKTPARTGAMVAANMPDLIMFILHSEGVLLSAFQAVLPVCDPQDGSLIFG